MNKTTLTWIVALSSLTLAGAGCGASSQPTAPAIPVAPPTAKAPVAAPPSQPTTTGTKTNVQKSDLDALDAAVRKMDSPDLTGLKQ